MLYHILSHLYINRYNFILKKNLNWKANIILALSSKCDFEGS